MSHKERRLTSEPNGHTRVGKGHVRPTGSREENVTLIDNEPRSAPTPTASAVVLVKDSRAGNPSLHATHRCRTKTPEAFVDGIS